MLKLKPLLLLTLGVASFSATSAFAGVIYDKGGMPRCIAQGDRHLLLFWDDKDLYSREIFTLDTATYSGNGNYSCQNLPSFGEVDKSELTALPKNAKSVGPISLTNERIRNSLAQIRQGGSAYRAEVDAKSFLRKYPVSQFTVALNRKLTAMYGVGFASEVYAEVIDQDVNNKAFTSLVAANLRADSAAVGAFKQNREIVYVKGLGHELPSAKKYDVLVDNLRAAGIPVKVVKTNSYEPVAKNAAVVKAALDMELKKGLNVILIGLSKGGAESLLGLSMLTSKLEGTTRPAGYGKVEAYLGLSGVYGGSFLVDWAGNYPQRLVMAEVLKSQYREEGKELPSVDGILDIRSENIDAAMKQVASNGLPQETTYFSIVGAMSGDGLADKGNYIRRLQDEMIRPRLEKYGANDGYIEFPSTAVPNKLVRKSYVARLNSSHALIDGTFQDAPVVGGKDNVLNAISIAVFQTLAR